jgi:hypothetical protein
MKANPGGTLAPLKPKAASSHGASCSGSSPPSDAAESVADVEDAGEAVGDEAAEEVAEEGEDQDQEEEDKVPALPEFKSDSQWEFY